MIEKFLFGCFWQASLSRGTEPVCGKLLQGDRSLAATDGKDSGRVPSTGVFTANCYPAGRGQNA